MLEVFKLCFALYTESFFVSWLQKSLRIFDACRIKNRFQRCFVYLYFLIYYISVTMKYCCSTSLKYYVTHHGLMMMRGITYDVMTVILMT